MSERLPLGDALREALPAYAAPEHLREFARAHAARELGESVRRRSSLRARFLIAASLVVTFGAGWITRTFVEHRNTTTQGNQLTIAVVDAHVHALMSGHVMDVQSTDQHTVKPWFAGKVPLAPSVPELSDDGFPLLGGRTESVSGRTSAVLVYGRRKHVIDLFIWTTPARDAAPERNTHHGFAAIHWTQRGLEYWAVSDVAAPDLATFVDRYRASLTE